MSEYEHIKGTISLVPFTGTLEETCFWCLNKQSITPDPEYGGDPNPFEMQLRDECYRDYVIHDNEVFEVVGAEEVEEFDIYNASITPDGSGINFEVCYYNGGCSFDEAVGIALDKMLKELDG